ncbi:unnamed protein product [Fusarium langsethiae]|nr:unnamed protein product [Fusarium langsethiae]
MVSSPDIIRKQRKLPMQLRRVHAANQSHTKVSLLKSVVDTQPIVQGTTTGTSPVVDTTTGTAPVIDTTQPVAQDTTAQPIVQSTTTGQPIIADTTSKQPPVQPTTKELKPPNVDTTTWLIVEDTSNQPINQTPGSQTPSRGPVDQDTTREQQSPVDNTTTGVPPVETTTQQTSVQDTTTTAAGQPVKITKESKPSTKDGQPAITQPPTTTAAAAAIASVSSVSSQVAALIPIINKWAEDPKSLTDETNKKVEDTHDDIIAVIVGLDGKPDVACNKNRGLGMRRLKRRGLLGPIGDVINKLACMAQDLTKISSNIIAGNVPAVTSVIPEVKSQNDGLTEEEENKSKEGKESTKQETTKKESTTEKPTSTEEYTTTATTTSDTIVCASGSCGGGSCPVGLGSGGSMPKRMHSIPRDIKCQDIPITTIDGPLPTGPVSLDGSKRDKGLDARMFLDGDMSPNPHYIDGVSMNPDTIWDDQSGLITGHFVGAPLDGGWSAAGVNGIYGCTAVLIVSNVGVYTSHIWEVPGFFDRVDKKPTSDDFFETNVFKVLRDGTPDATTATGISTLIGTESAPGPLHSQFEPHVFVVTPFNTNQSPENPSLFRYEARADQLANQVTGIIPGALSGGVYGYFPRGNVESTGRGFLGRTIVEFDMLDGFIASEQDPTKLQALGRWRFWVEENIWATHSFNEILDDPQQASLLVESSIVIYNTPITNDEVQGSFRYIMNDRNQYTMHRTRSILVDEVISRGNKCLDLAIKRSWPDFSRTAEWSLASSTCYWLETSSGQRQVDLNVLTGELLVNGAPLARLPRDYSMHEDHERLFRSMNLDVMPSDALGMRFSATREFLGYTVHFGMQGQDLLVQLHKPGSILDLVPSRLLKGTVSHQFATNFAHWYQRKTKCTRESSM